MISTSLLINGIWVPATSVEKQLGDFATNLFVWNDDPTYKISLPGSASRLKYKGRHFLVCTKHQLTGHDPKNVCLMTNDGSKLVTSPRFWMLDDPAHQNESDAYDIAAFDFGQKGELSEFNCGFFNFNTCPSVSLNSSIVAFIVIGFPSNDQLYELENNNHLGSFWRILIASHESQSNDPAVLELRYHSELDFDPDGLSGGPVFVVQAGNRLPNQFLRASC